MIGLESLGLLTQAQYINHNIAYYISENICKRLFPLIYQWYPTTKHYLIIKKNYIKKVGKRNLLYFYTGLVGKLEQFKSLSHEK